MAIWIDGTKKCNRKAILVLNIVLNVGLLFVYKYLDFSIISINRILGTNIELCNIVLPIGISFFTFQAMSYVIDVYRKEVNVQKNIFYVALYISFFPQLIAGPIVRYSTIEQQIINRKFSFSQYGEGIRRFVLGFSKKIIIANNLASVSQMVFVDDVNSLSRNGLMLWLGAICFTLQIYFDFSGYSDMAIGLGKMFGFDFLENFNYPYIAQSITDFWRRWHISLSSWFRDYVYIPLGGSKRGVLRQVINLFIVWSFTGLWHGANYTFIVWGLYYFILLIVEKFLIKPDRIKNKFVKNIYRILTLFIVNFAWVIFNSPDVNYGVRYCARMIGVGTDMEWSWNLTLTKTLNQYGCFIIMGIFFSTPIAVKMKRILTKSKWGSGIVVYGSQVVYIFVFLWAVSYLVLGAHNPFIYFNF